MSKKTTADRDRTREIREKANAQRRLEETRRKRRRLFAQLGVGAAVVVLVAGIWGGASLLRDQAAAGSVPPTADADVELASGGQAQVTAEADAVSVGAADAPVTLDIYEDYSCPHCQEYEATTGDLLDRLAGSGQVRVVYHPIQIVTNYGSTAGSTAACVLQHDPSAWPDVHSALFANHSAATDSWTGADFSSWLTSRGVTDPEAITCTEKGAFTSWIGSNTDVAAAAGVTGTPTLMIGGQKTATVSGQGLVDALTAAGASLPSGIAAG
ncbi:MULTISPECIES: thioredoxin domain-containing protein [Clavibacter]|uniref:DsbA family protein n=1 Tax=Clavibacter TaxID=1573 RepID=UPI00188D15C7|nr:MULTISPECIES: thioredoxin domain-containing protein [Clavibacter]MBF4621441.1 thioredoxin domain-containing protein [Clavibacter sp. VKM Ac-2542]MBM7412330.1 protein-disulfide isomerase [Clavibacter michiganensis]